MHVPNLPTEEVFTTPDPARIEGYVRSTKPLFVSGAMVNGLRIALRARARRSRSRPTGGRHAARAGCSGMPAPPRLGEVALVDGESRIGSLDTVFFDTLLDENAASHIALGEGLDFTVGRRGARRGSTASRAPHRLHDRVERRGGDGDRAWWRRGAAAARWRLADLRDCRRSRRGCAGAPAVVVVNPTRTSRGWRRGRAGATRRSQPSGVDHGLSGGSGTSGERADSNSERGQPPLRDFQSRPFNRSGTSPFGRAR